MVRSPIPNILMATSNICHMLSQHQVVGSIATCNIALRGTCHLSVDIVHQSCTLAQLPYLVFFWILLSFSSMLGPCDQRELLSIDDNERVVLMIIVMQLRSEVSTAKLKLMVRKPRAKSSYSPLYGLNDVRWICCFLQLQTSDVLSF